MAGLLAGLFGGAEREDRDPHGAGFKQADRATLNDLASFTKTTLGVLRSMVDDTRRFALEGVQATGRLASAVAELALVLVDVRTAQGETLGRLDRLEAATTRLERTVNRIARHVAPDHSGLHGVTGVELDPPSKEE